MSTLECLECGSRNGLRDLHCRGGLAISKTAAIAMYESAFKRLPASGDPRSLASGPFGYHFFGAGHPMQRPELKPVWDARIASRLRKYRQPRIFAAIPFHSPHSDQLWNIIASVAEENEYEVVRPDEVAQSRLIITAIYEQIQRARIVIVDLSDLNPNVIYELGFAHAHHSNHRCSGGRSNECPADGCPAPASESALELARTGHTVYASMRNPSRFPEVSEQAAMEGLAVKIVKMDVDSDESVSECFGAIYGQGGDIEVLINNAGIDRHGSVEELSMEAFRATMETNCQLLPQGEVFEA
ncbi:MAG: SDR family NAD(P)-dependent oxidoreductase [Bryobacteraceae bacterium]